MKNPVKKLHFMSLLSLMSLFMSACGETSPETFYPGSTQNVVPYEESSYLEALNQNKTVLLKFVASWCGVCADNEPELELAFAQLQEEGNLDQIVIFEVNFDTQDDLKSEFSVFAQPSYIIIPNGNPEAFETLGPGPVDSENFIKHLSP